MDRRRFLAAAALVGPVGAGCLGELYPRGRSHQGPTIIGGVPEGMVVRTEYWGTDVLTDGIWECRPDPDGRRPRGGYTLITDSGGADGRFRDDAVDEATVIVETDFTSAYVVVVQYVMQTGRWLELGTLSRTHAGIQATVTGESPRESVPDDGGPHSLGIEITDDHDGIPEKIRVEIDGNPITHEF